MAEKERSKKEGKRKKEEEDEEERRYKQMTEERLNQAFMKVLRWLANEAGMDNIYNNGCKENFREVLHPICERKMEGAKRTKKIK